MLVSKERILPFLICPKSKNRLFFRNGKLVSEDGNNIYEILNGFPILIDFSTSILSKDEILNSKAESVISRSSYKGYKYFFKNLISPTSKSTLNNIKLLKKELFKISTKPKLLVIGGGTIGKGLLDLYNDINYEIIAFDIYASNNVQFVADAHNIPFQDGYFDGVIIQAVLEHVLEPIEVVAEIHRVLKKNGIVYSETPFIQHVHEGAYDFNRFTDSGHRYLFKDFNHIYSGSVAGVGTQLLWSCEYFTRSLFRSKLIGKIFKLLLFWLQYFDYIIPESYTIDAASCAFFLGQKSEKSIDPKDLVVYYKGAQ